jgi:predicted dienelactone hydrolase
MFRIAAIALVCLLCGMTVANAASQVSEAVGFQVIRVPYVAGTRIAVGIWYPTTSRPQWRRLEVFTQDVALNGTIQGSSLPLVLISHGVLGSMASHYDTALALARAGYVVAAPTMSGDSWSDPRMLGQRADLVQRPLEMERVLDYMLRDWCGAKTLDRRRVGIFGHSLGAFTALVLIGGKPNLNLIPDLCRRNPIAPECQFIRRYHGDPLSSEPSKIAWSEDVRIKSAVLAAPALGFTFGNDGLNAVHVPVELWIAKYDTISPNAWNSNVVGRDLPDNAQVLTVPAGHLAFRAPCNQSAKRTMAFVCSDVKGFDRVSFHAALNRELVDFFDRTLR